MNRMSDRELLERAAMAGGVCVTYHHDSGTFYDTTAQGNPAMNLLSRPTCNPLYDGDMGTWEHNAFDGRGEVRH